MTTEIRTFTPDLEVRRDGDGRTICGIAVPYNVTAVITPQLTEQFARSSFNAQLRAANRVKFSRDHLQDGGTLIGRAVLLRDDAAGLYGEWRVSDTPVGNETLTLVKDGALEELSVAFSPQQDRRLAGGVIERVTARLAEVAVVLRGAYGLGAVASGVRAQAGSVGDHGQFITPGLDALALVLAANPRFGVQK